MAGLSEKTTPAPPPQAGRPGADRTSAPTSSGTGARPVRILIGVVGLVVTVWAMCNLFLAFAMYPELFANSNLLIGILGLVVGIGGAMLLFRFLNMAVEGLPSRWSEGIIPYAFLLPGLSFIALMLVYPTVQTVVYSFANRDSTEWVRLENYQKIFSDQGFRSALFNNLLWILIVPIITVAFGLAVAVMADKLSATGEKVSKSMVFLPMSISFVGASTIWGLVYAYNAPGTAQTGLLNALWVAIGGEPQPWLQIDTARLNSLLLMIILIWLQTGFAMVLLSSAIKAVPEETIEAGRIDGASEFRIFWSIIFPQVRATMLAVFVTVLILVLKVFDIIYVMTNGRDDTDVIANLFFRRLFVDANAGQASAIVVVLLILIIPILIYQVWAYKQQEANR